MVEPSARGAEVGSRMSVPSASTGAPLNEAKGTIMQRATAAFFKALAERVFGIP
jgi:hypothetical protein